MQRDELIQVEANPAHSEEADTGTGSANESDPFQNLVSQRLVNSFIHSLTEMSF